MRFNKIMGILFAAALALGTANAALIEEVKVSAEDAKKFTKAPKIIEEDGKKVFVADTPGWKNYNLKKRIKVDPEKKYVVSLNVKQFGEQPANVWIGFIPYDDKGHIILPYHGHINVKESFTALAADASKGAKTITVKDASKWKSGKHFYVAFNVKEDMSDIPNYDVTHISKIENNTIILTKPLKKAYPAGTKIREHRSGGTYIYTKSGKAPAKWTGWKGKPAQGKILRKAAYIRPMILFQVKKDSGVVFSDFVVEDADKK